MSDIIFCARCNRGGNGNDKDKCSCGCRETKLSSLGCCLGTPIVWPIKPQPKLTRSQQRFARYRRVADCFESFKDFLKYEQLKGECE